MKFAVIGVGGVGGYYGGHLARAGEDVTFVARGEHYEALRKNGLLLRTVEGEFSIQPIKIVDSIGKLEKPEVVLLSTKTYDRDTAAKQLESVIGERTIIIPLLNGIDNDLEMKKLLPKATIYPGLAYIISARTAPGVVEQTAGPRTILFGDRGRPDNAELREIEGIMRRANLLATAAPDIVRELWIKFLWITAFAGLTGVCRCPIGTIVNDPDGFALLERCLEEGFAVATALGVHVNEKDLAVILEKSAQYKKDGVNAKSSMLVDIEHKRRTEVEALNGAIVRLGRQHGVKTPIHETIYHAIRLGSEFALGH